MFFAEKEARQRVIKRLADMVAMHLFGEGGQLHQCLLNELAERTGYSTHTVQDRLIDAPWWEDVPAIAQAAGLKLGVSLRSPNGDEVTFYPEHNFDQRHEAPLNASAKLREHSGK